jgi:uncharacterized membrane protein
MIMTIVLWIVIAAFAVIGILHLMSGEPIRAAYKAWKYPAGFHFVTGILEVATAVLLFLPGTRLLGLALGALICVAAIATLIWNKQYSHLVGPIPLIAAIAYLHFG